MRDDLTSFASFSKDSNAISRKSNTRQSSGLNNWNQIEDPQVKQEKIKKIVDNFFDGKKSRISKGEIHTGKDQYSTNETKNSMNFHPYENYGFSKMAPRVQRLSVDDDSDDYGEAGSMY